MLKKIIGAVILILGITLTVTGAYMINKCERNIMAVGPFVAFAGFNLAAFGIIVLGDF